MLFRKKSVVVEANVFRGGEASATSIINWASNFGSDSITYCHADDALKMNTIDGVVSAYAGDYVVRGATGVFQLCKAEDFDETLEVVW